MSALSVQVPFPVFQNSQGQPLEDGYVWIGQANLDPQVNPINVYWDAALTISAAQPIRTLGGYLSNSGTPARLYVNSDYSIRVMNKNGSVVYSAPTQLLNKVSVTDFGAVGDGVTDDTAAIQAAVNVGGEIIFPTGVYVIGSTVNIPSNVKMSGDGKTSILKLANGANTHIFQNSNYVSGSNENIKIDGLIIDGNVVNQTNNGAYNKHGIRLKNTLRFYLQNSVIRNVGTDCINMIDSNDACIVQNTLHGAYNHAVTFQGCDGLLGENNTIYNCGSKTDALGFTSSGHAFIGVNDACNNVRLVGNYVYDMGDSCLRNERAGQGWVISNNLVINSGKDSIKIMGVVGSSVKPKANIITGNVIIDAGNTGIVANGDGTIVSNNSIYGTGKNPSGAAAGKWFASASGIAILDDSKNVVVSSNYVREAYSTGVIIEGGFGCVIKENNVTLCGTNGIEANNHNGCVIENNEIFDNGTALTSTHAGIRINGTSASYSRHSVRSNRCYNTGANGHLWGIRLEGGANVSQSLVQFNQLWGNTNTSQLFTNWSGAGNVINQNTGYITENRGTAIVLAGSTSVAVQHGCSITPSPAQVSVTPLSQLSAGTIWTAGAPNSTQFFISLSAAQANDRTFSWQILP
jgi:hypothetical protein